jgi:glycyl-tRNA synthetase (class II)
MKRYAECDELGVSLVLTVNDQIFDDIVALRECGSCEQIKGKTGEIIRVIQDLVNNQLLSVHFSLHTCQVILFY